MTRLIKDFERSSDTKTTTSPRCGLKAVNEFVDEDALLVRKRRHAGTFDLTGWKEDDDDQREADGDEEIRVQTRISLRIECGDEERWASDGRGCQTCCFRCWEFASCFSSELSIFGYLVFIACPSQPAPDGNCTSSDSLRRRPRCSYFLFDSAEAAGRCLERECWISIFHSARSSGKPERRRRRFPCAG
jgi:hypothetical protein